MKTPITKQEIIDLLRDFVESRPGLEFANYGDYKLYRSESRSITNDLHDARALLRSVELRDSLTKDDLLKGFDAFSGRLSLVDDHLEYCTGQYYPTEYRKAVCAVLSSALWNYWRDDAPEDIENKGQYLHNVAKREFGRGIAKHWFN
jgi:hypothetical protein